MYDEDEKPLNVAELRKRAERFAAALDNPTPAVPHGKGIARSFWGRQWCRHIELLQDYESRLPGGRSYLKNGTVVDLKILPGRVEAKVAGSELYEVDIRIEPLPEERKEELKAKCAGQITSLVDLLEGNLSESIIEILCDPDTGLFPHSHEIKLECNCLDWADLCKHLAATLYGIAARLDDDPGLFFTLRGIDREEFFAGDLSSALPEVNFNLDELGDTFEIDLS